MTQAPVPLDILITIPFAPEAMETLQAVSPRLRLTTHSAKKAADIPADVWNRAEVLYTTPLILPTEDQAPNLKWIQFHYAGIDKAENASLLNKHGLQVTTLSGAAAPQMGEFALTMLLSLGHRLPAIRADQRKVEWASDRWQRFIPQELRGSTVGIIGYGSIGRQIARLLHPFGATILATKRNAMHPADTGYILEGFGDPEGDFVHRLYPHTAVRSMVKECDFVIVTVPLTPETRGLINADVLATMKPTAFLIDISRGGVTDHKALVKALETRQLAGVALDVFPEEPLPPGSPLWQMPNVIISPHIAGVSPHYNTRAAALFAENLRRYLEGQPLFNIYDPEKGY